MTLIALSLTQALDKELHLSPSICNCIHYTPRIHSNKTRRYISSSGGGGNDYSGGK